MRCPSCGNENPDDYTFCDECGAKLTPQGGEGTTPGATQDVVYAQPSSGEFSAPLNSGPIGIGGEQPMTPMAPMAMATTDTKAPGEVCPNCGAVTVPGEAYCNECGAELTAASASASAAPFAAAPFAAPAGESAPAPDMSGTMEPYMGAMETSSESGGVSIGVPITEDTMPSKAQTQAADMPQGEAAQETSMPGVMPIETMADTGTAQAATMEQPMPMPMPMPGVAPDMGASAMSTTTPETMGASAMSTNTSTAAWATDALTQLEEAQQSMAKGDWVAYGQSMNALKAFLESVAKGTAPQVAGMDVAASPRPHQPVVDEATAAEIMSGGMAVPVPMPQAIPGSDTASASAYPGASASAAAGLARLVVIATGAELPLPTQEEITIGREDPSSGIFPDIDLTPYGGEDGGVSRRHARLLHIGSDYYVEDLQSTNYTKLDGQRLPARVREKVDDGARLDFGRVAMIFRNG